MKEISLMRLRNLDNLKEIILKSKKKEFTSAKFRKEAMRKKI